MKLEEKIKHILVQSDQHFIDPANGLMYSYIDRKTLEVGLPELFPERLWFIPADISMADLYMHENFGMANGSLLCAEVLRYQDDGDPAALARAKRAFDGLYQVLETGKTLEYGFYPKIYGGRFSKETSTDQVLYACYAADCYFAVADESDRKRIAELISALVRFWVKRDYRYHYFTLQGDDWQWPLQRFPALLALAAHYDADPCFRSEYRRILALSPAPVPEHCSLWIRQHHLTQPEEYELKHQAWLTGNGADRITMAAMQEDLLLRYGQSDEVQRDKWREALKIMWNEVKDSFADDGRYYTMQLFDFKTGKSRRTPGDGSDDYPGAKSAWSTMVARGAMMILAYVPELADEILPKVDLVLDQLDFFDLTYYDEPERFPLNMRFKTQLLSGDAVSNYLWCAQLRLAYLKKHGK